MVTAQRSFDNSVDRFSVVDNPPQKPLETEGLESRLTKLIDSLWRLTSSSRQRRYYIWTMLELFAKGIHYVSYDSKAATFTEWDAATIKKCMYTPVPLVEYAVENVAAQYGTSKPRIVPHAPSEDRKTKTVVRELQTVADCLFAKFYLKDPEERQRESKYMPTRNIAYNFLEYDKTKGPEYDIPNLQPKQQFFCAECGTEVSEETSPMPICPQCGSQNLEPMMGMENKGMVKARQGEVVRHVPDPFQVEIYDRRTDVDKSPYLFFDEILFVAEAKKLYPNVKIEGKACLGNWESGYCGLHYMLQIETLVSNTGRLDQSRPDYGYTTGYGGAYLNELLCWRRRVWIDNYVYADWELTQPTQLPGTDKIIQASKEQPVQLGPIYPDGLIVHVMNGKTIVQLENQNKNGVWSSYKYRVPTTGLHGPAVMPILSLNRGYDELTSFQMQAALMNALGITLVDERIKSFENTPGEYYYVPIDARPMGESLASLIEHKQTGGPSQGVEALRQSLRENIADLSMTSSPNASGLDREGMRTATGVRNQAGAINALTAPPLELFGAAVAKVIEQAVQLEKKNNVKPRFYGQHGQSASIWFDPMNIPEDVEFMAEEDSTQPRTLETRKQDFGGAIQIGIGTGTIMNPALEERGMQLFGLNDSDMDPYQDTLVKGERRLDAMKELLPQIQQQSEQVMAETGGQIPIDPMSGLPVYDPAVELLKAAGAMPTPMDNPMLFDRYWTEVYNDDQYDLEYPPLLQQAIQKVWELHKNAGAILASQEAARNVQASAPMRAMENQPEPPNEAEAEQAEVEHARGQEAADAEHGRGMEMMDRQHNQAKEMERMKQRHAMELEQVRAKSKAQKEKSR